MPADSAPINLTNHFLIAMPGLSDDLFGRSVVFMCEHSDRGALGLVINKPSDILLPRLFEKVELALGRADLVQLPVFQGGPVQTERGFVLHRPVGDWDSMLRIGDELGVTTSRDILTALAAGNGPQDILVALGYAGWGPGQLEHELAQNAWLNCPADARILFELPSGARWDAAAALIGVDITRLSNDAGHA